MNKRNLPEPDNTWKTKSPKDWDKALDSVIAAPKSHMVIYEDETKRELLVTLSPGAKEPMHHHSWPSEVRVMRSATLRYYAEGGQSFDIPKKDASPEKPFVERLEPEPLHSLEI